MIKSFREWVILRERAYVMDDDDFYELFGDYMSPPLPSKEKGKINTQYLRDFDMRQRKAMWDKIENWSIFQTKISSSNQGNNELKARSLMLAQDPGTTTMGDVVRAMLMGDGERSDVASLN